MTRRLDRPVLIGLGLTVVSFVIYWFWARDFDAGRGDFFYLADAFLHGRTYLLFQPGPFDVIIVDGRFYVPFAPFPAIALMPLVAVLGAVTADIWQLVNDTFPANESAGLPGTAATIQHDQLRPCGGGNGGKPMELR